MLNIVVAAATDRGRRRKKNEDRAAARVFDVDGVPVCLLAVADGVGGAPAGDCASELAIRSVESWAPDAATVAGLNAIFGDANRRITEDASRYPDRRGMGTTFVVALVIDARLSVANVGDSRAYLVREGAASQISRDHSLVAERIKVGMITSEEAERSPLRNVITRSLGTADKPDVDVFNFGVVTGGDSVVLCSDGLYGMVSDKLIAECASSLQPEAAVRELIRQANRAGGHDNIAIAIARLTNGSEEGNGRAD